MHKLIERATGRKDRRTDLHDDSLYPELRSYHTGFRGVTIEEFLEAAAEVRTVIDNDEDKSSVELAELLADWRDLLFLARQAGAMSVPVFAIVSTYDPHGSFRPGERVTWSGHHTREEAERVLPLWEKRLNRPRDPMVVESDWPTDLYQIKKDGWEPRR